jgi:hypothetical protein
MRLKLEEASVGCQLSAPRTAKMFDLEAQNPARLESQAQVRLTDFDSTLRIPSQYQNDLESG